MLTRRRFLKRAGGAAALLAGAAVFGPACGTEGPDRDAPPTLRYGEERCAYCTMSIDDARFAAAWRTPSGGERHFDDIGCMVNAYRREAPASDSRFWVHDYRSQEWQDAGAATYLTSPSFKTPMGYGVAAFASAADAATAVPAAKTMLAWAELLTAVERKG
ncbi:MAG: twin-arginine translocation signal domain-containing protein [Dehalococcoidia bacterium]|nr:MAG: twin-arginine translocation signal domain-containing protein [Dehalococcoidia bacterium]